MTLAMILLSMDYSPLLRKSLCVLSIFSVPRWYTSYTIVSQISQIHVISTDHALWTRSCDNTQCTLCIHLDTIITHSFLFLSISSENTKIQHKGYPHRAKGDMASSMIPGILSGSIIYAPSSIFWECLSSRPIVIHQEQCLHLSSEYITNFL